jgi:L-ribulose-5-phosphate 4-epimerase
MTEKGYLKFKCEWIRTGPLSESEIAEMNRWRAVLYGLRLIGAYPNGPGYGNISRRAGPVNQFIISGTNTGRLTVLDGSHYTRVTAYDFHLNRLTCEGPIQASSESLTHAAIYQAAPPVQAVIHVHSLDIWERLRDKLPTTSWEVEYGTPEMAQEMLRVLKDPELGQRGVVVMGGHREGLVAFGSSLESAAETLVLFSHPGS